MTVGADRTVVVLGGGMSGLCAALAATGTGAEVVVLEEAPVAGGSMRLSGGLVWGPRDLATARRYIPRGDAGLQRMFVDGLPEAWDWLESLGLPLGPPVDCLKDDMGRGRVMGLGETGSRGLFAERMADLVRARGGRVVLGAEVSRLRRAATSGWEVTARELGSERTYRADAVIAATGGFQNSQELLRRFVTPTPSKLVVRSNRHSRGTALALLEANGAALSNGMSSFYGHSLPDLGGRELEPQHFIPASQYYSDYALVINQLGLRFTDESIGVLDEHNAQQGARQPDCRYHLVFDEGIRRRHVTGAAGLPGVLGSQVTDRLALVKQLGGTVLSADTLPELARQLELDGVPAANVLDTVAHYNSVAATGRGETLFPPRSSHLEPLVEPPYYAVACVAAITYTMGGLRVDDACAVLDASGERIPGAWAVGADAGGVFQDVYGGGLGWALVSGRAAGAAAGAP